jgi:hypothetical protein
MNSREIKVGFHKHGVLILRAADGLNRVRMECATTYRLDHGISSSLGLQIAERAPAKQPVRPAIRCDRRAGSGGDRICPKSLCVIYERPTLFVWKSYALTAK